MAQPRRSKSRISSADRSIWPGRRPCRAQDGPEWWPLCHLSPERGQGQWPQVGEAAVGEQPVEPHRHAQARHHVEGQAEQHVGDGDRPSPGQPHPPARPTAPPRSPRSASAGHAAFRPRPRRVIGTVEGGGTVIRAVAAGSMFSRPQSGDLIGAHGALIRQQGDCWPGPSGTQRTGRPRNIGTAPADGRPSLSQGDGPVSGNSRSAQRPSPEPIAWLPAPGRSSAAVMTPFADRLFPAARGRD